MADHFVALNRGVEGTKYSDFITGTASAATALFEVRILDGVNPTPAEVYKFLEAMDRYFQNPQQWAAAGFQIKG